MQATITSYPLVDYSTPQSCAIDRAILIHVLGSFSPYGFDHSIGQVETKNLGNAAIVLSLLSRSRQMKLEPIDFSKESRLLQESLQAWIGIETITQGNSIDNRSIRGRDHVTGDIEGVASGTLDLMDAIEQHDYREDESSRSKCGLAYPEKCC